MRWGAVLGALLALAGCQSRGAAPAGVPTRAATVAPSPSVSDALSAAQPEPDAACRPGARQTGAGCDMAGIVATIAPLRQPGGEIPRCYLEHVRPAISGKLQLRFALTPEGRGGQWQWPVDDFHNLPLRLCLQEALAALTFPPPGDKPCQVVYPFTFLPEVRRGP